MGSYFLFKSSPGDFGVVRMNAASVKCVVREKPRQAGAKRNTPAGPEDLGEGAGSED